MSSTRNPDRLIRAWLDLMPDEAPDRAIATVLQAIETTPQVRRPLVPALRRFSPMNRRTFAAAAAVIVAVIGGGAILLNRAQGPNAGGPSGSSAVESPSPAASAAATALSIAFRSTWLADAAPIAGLGNTEPRMRLVVSADGSRLYVDVNSTSTAQTMLASQSSADVSNEVALISEGTAVGCAANETGRYGAAISADGAYLTLTPVSDTCATRAITLGRTWVRWLDRASTGGRGLFADFDPAILVTLPGASYTPEPGQDAATASSSADRTFIAVKNPAGFSDPCSATGGAKVQIPHTIVAFSAYLKGLPGITVQSESLSIDGHPAAHLIMPVSPTVVCSGGRVNEWTTGDVATQGGWLIRPGDTDIVYLVEVDKDLYLLQWLGGGVTSTEELAVLSTVHFVTGLPSGS